MQLLQNFVSKGDTVSFRYRLYGLKVESEIEISEAYREDFSGEPEFCVRLGMLPEELQNKISHIAEDQFFCTTSSSAMVFRIPNVADYHANGQEIVVRLIREDVNQEVKTFLLGSAFGFAMLLRRMVVLHGGAVSKYGKGVIITGESGAGKSTVTNGLQEKAYAFIADDVCALTEQGERMHINMAYPQQKLCRDAALKMGYDLADLIYINEDRDKFAVRLKDNYLPDGMDFDFLFEIVLSDQEELAIKKVEGHEKLMLLIRNIYRGEGAFKNWGMPTDYMKHCLKIASTIQVYQIARPQNHNTLSDIVDFIDKTVSENNIE